MSCLCEVIIYILHPLVFISMLPSEQKKYQTIANGILEGDNRFDVPAPGGHILDIKIQRKLQVPRTLSFFFTV